MMGWIHKRHMQDGGSLNRNPARQRKGPLRKIVRVLVNSTGIFDADWVELDCGHKVRAWGQHRARCDTCKAEGR